MASSFPNRYQQFLRELKAARESRGVTQADINASLGLYRTFMSKAESGERRLDVVELIAVCKVIGIDPAEFVRRLAKQLEPS